MLKCKCYHFIFLTLIAFKPLCVLVVSNSTLSDSLIGSVSALMCTKTDSPLFASRIKPKPLLPLNVVTVPVLISSTGSSICLGTPISMSSAFTSTRFFSSGGVEERLPF